MLAATSAHAGPPYATDDAGPIEGGVIEAIAYGQATRVPGETDTTLGLDLSYALARDVQVTAIIPHHHHAIAGAANASGFGDVELGVKYRALGQQDGSWLPSVAIHTVIRLPTAERGFGSGKTGATTTVWLQRDFGPWSAFGGGGYTINPGAGNKDYSLQGFALTRQVGERLNLGAELFRQDASEDGGSANFRLGIGATYALDERFSLLASIARGLHRPDKTGRYAVYLGLMMSH